jgi:aromatic ring-opening dioxygenase catalytic subunit (LigB family)
LRRGGTNLAYGTGVHQDYGIFPDEIYEQFIAYQPDGSPELADLWKNKFDSEDV